MGPTRIVFTGKREVALEPFAPQAVGPDQVRVKTLYTLMSTGTENIIFNRLFDPGTPWDDWVRYPFYPGYSAIGVVSEIGSAAQGVEIGATVALRYGHASEHVASADHLFVVPESVAPSDAVWFSLAKIAFMGARAADYRLGETLLIIGAGPIGQMSVRWAAAAGLSRVVVVDPVEARLALATRGGASHVIAKAVAACREDVLAACDGDLPRIVNDATGNAEVFAAALQLAARFGRVVVLGDTGSPSSQRLTSDVIMRGLHIVGAHDVHNDERWNNRSITRLFFDLVRRGRFDLAGLNTHYFRPESAPEAYAAANARRGETMGIVFDWTRAETATPAAPARVG